MADPLVLKTPTNAEPRQTDREALTQAADIMRKVLVSKATAVVKVTVLDAGGTPMAFKISGSGVDGASQADGYPYAAGSHDVYSTDGGDPTRGKIDGDTWTFLVSGDDANPVLHFESDLHRGT